MSKTPLGTVSLLAILLAMGCSASSASTSNGYNSGAGGTGSGITSNGGDGTFVVGSSGGSGVSQVDGGRPLRCDPNGQNCFCMNIAEIGTAGQFGSTPGSDGDVAFQNWMNDPANSNAHVDLYKTQPAMTADFLKNYDVIVLQSLSNNSASGVYWSFSPAEIAAVNQWVNDGGAIISLMGYSGNTNETIPTNSLINFSGIAYNQDDIIVDGDCKLLRDGNGQQMCYCATAIGITDWMTDQDVQGLSVRTDPGSQFAVGAYHGRSINSPSDGHVAATFTSANGTKSNVLVGKAVGKGHVLAYADEWITYTSQWDGTNNSHTSEQLCQGYLPQEIFQTAQFWFNMIKWSVPDAKCFEIHSTTQPVQIW